VDVNEFSRRLICTSWSAWGRSAPEEPYRLPARSVAQGESSLRQRPRSRRRPRYFLTAPKRALSRIACRFARGGIPWFSLNMPSLKTAPASHSTDAARPQSRPRHLTGVGLAVWLLVVAIGFGIAWNYELTEGPVAAPPQRWPAASGVARIPGRPTLVMAVHPHCPCTRATLEELNRLLAQISGKLPIHLLFVRPPALPANGQRQISGGMPNRSLA